MKRLIIIAVALCVSQFAFAAGGGARLIPANVNLEDVSSLQRGARTFVNYCVSCHSASYMRYNRIATDLQLTEEVVAENLMFTTDKIGHTMKVALRPGDAAEWFGVAPPDLSVIARSRGADWLNTFLLTFYEDSSKATGVNNQAFADTAMPHVLWELQGIKRPVLEMHDDGHGNEHEVIVGYEVVVPGTQDEKEYARTVRDLVNFLVYLGEPAKLVRYNVGFWVLMFLAFFMVVAYALKKEYWKDVH